MLDQAFQMAIQKEEEDNKADSISTENWRSSDLVLQKLFGIKQYRYKLKLKHRFPAVIFKQRNMALALELVDIKDGIVLNSNLINLCVSACETTGQWISQNEEGDYFIKGKTEVELYHGKAAFQKIYPRDVSRQYPNGKLSIVIYPKTSLVQFCTYASTLQKMVKAQEIEPLIIHDLTIRAKKKSTH